MVNYTRMDCAIGSAALMRAALAQRSIMPPTGEPSDALLIEHPLMQNVLADLALESEAATVLCMRVARAIDESAARSASGSAETHRDRLGQILRLQASPRGGRRGAGMPGRKRLRRRIHHAAALSRGPLELDLGRIG